MKCDFKGRVAPGAPAGAHVESAHTSAHVLKLCILLVGSPPQFLKGLLLLFTQHSWVHLTLGEEGTAQMHEHCRM